VSRLILIRHVEPVEDARGLCYGSLDFGLSPAGHEHAGRIARALAGVDYGAVHTSPRLRARETAEPVAAARGIDVAVDDDLREIDFGDFEGRSYEEIEAAEPELYRAWMESPTTVRFPGGEGYADVRVRALRAFERIRTVHPCAVVVTHGGVIRAGLAEWLGMPAEAIFRLGQSYGGITVVDWLEGVPLVRVMNGESVPS
jgi:broad specificity phosphatase PhoE